MDDPSTWFGLAKTFRAIHAFIPVDSALNANDGGLRAARIGGYERGSFEVWSRRFSESACTAAPEDMLFLLRVCEVGDESLEVLYCMAEVSSGIH